MKLSQEECEVCNSFREYYEHLEKTKLLIGTQLVNEDEPDKVFFMNVAVATALTIIKGKTDIHPFA